MTQTRKWTIGTAIAVVVILAAGWFLLAKPQRAKVAELHEQTAAQEQTNSSLLTQIAALQSQQKQLPQQQLILEKFSTEVPDTPAEPTLIRQLSSAAKGAGVDLAAITPGSPTALSAAPAAGTQTLSGGATAGAPQLYRLPLTLSISGAYANIESFFSSLEGLPRAFLVGSFSLAPGGGDVAAGQNALRASVSASVFYAPGTAPLPVVTPTPAPGDTTDPASSPSPAAPDSDTTPAATTSPSSAISRPALPLNPLNN